MAAWRINNETSGSVIKQSQRHGEMASWHGAHGASEIWRKSNGENGGGIW